MKTSNYSRWRTIANIVGLVLTWATWLYLAVWQPPSPVSLLVIALFGMLAIVPSVYLGRKMLDRQPTIERAEWVTTLVHYLVGGFFGSALICALRLAQGWLSPGESAAGTALQLRLPAWIGLAIMIVSGVILVIVVVNLFLKGLGLPFAVSLTRAVASEWLYAWTRNPMILGALAFLVGLGFWLQSGPFLIWTLAVVSPVLMYFLKVYEERELELRFGESYLDYKRRTPMLWPRKPKG